MKMINWPDWLFRVLFVATSIVSCQDGNTQKKEVHNVSCRMHDSKNTSGVCKSITDCPAVIGLLRSGIMPTVCTSVGPTVCCPNQRRISSQKCDDFISVLTRPIKSKQALTYDSTSNEKEIQDKTVKCEAFLIGFITGGRQAREREYPYQVALGYGNSENPDWRCGGVLIDSQFVLTAGHCIITSFGPPKVVLLGDRQLRKRQDPSRILMKTLEIFLHPKYSPPLQYNDIAIIKLSNEVPLSRAILPACLPDPADRLDRALGVEATGWGQTGAFEGQSDILQSAMLAKSDSEECSSFFLSETGNTQRWLKASSFIVNLHFTSPYDSVHLFMSTRIPQGIIKSQFCAGDKQGFRDTCKGDSGGPLTVSKINETCIHYVVGITSFGSSLCGYQQPGVYTNILSFLNWIEDVVWYNNGSLSSGRSKLYTKVKPNNEGLVLNPSAVEPPEKVSSNEVLNGNVQSINKIVSESLDSVKSSTSIPMTSTTTSTTTTATNKVSPPTSKLKTMVSVLPETSHTATSTTILDDVLTNWPSFTQMNAGYSVANFSDTLSNLLNQISTG